MYHLQRFLRLIKIKSKTADRQKVLRTGAVLLIFFAALGVSPPQVEKKEEEVQGVAEAPEEKERGSDLPQRLPDYPPMASISAQAAYVVDSKTGATLFEKNAETKLPMASLTKIMTALVVLKNFSLEEIVSVPEVCTQIPSLRVGYEAGAKIAVEDLLYGMLVTSAADAACALSHHYPGDFLYLMNQEAQELELDNTHFENEVGLDDENGNHFSTARDLTQLSAEALKSGVFRKIVGTKEWQGAFSTNELLLTLPGTTGIKTGYTQKAKECLAISYERDGREIIGILLGSDDRFGEVEVILEWVFAAYSFP